MNSDNDDLIREIIRAVVAITHDVIDYLKNKEE